MWFKFQFLGRTEPTSSKGTSTAQAYMSILNVSNKEATISDWEFILSLLEQLAGLPGLEGLLISISRTRKEGGSPHFPQVPSSKSNLYLHNEANFLHSVPEISLGSEEEKLKQFSLQYLVVFHIHN